MRRGARAPAAAGRPQRCQVVYSWHLPHRHGGSPWSSAAWSWSRCSRSCSRG